MMIAVWTVNSDYLIAGDDAAGWTLTRLAGGLGPPDDDPDGWFRLDLRRDGEPVELVDVVRLVEGEPAWFVIRLYPEGRPELVTERVTTPVRAIRQLDDGGAGC